MLNMAEVLVASGPGLSLGLQRARASLVTEAIHAILGEKSVEEPVFDCKTSQRDY